MAKLHKDLDFKRKFIISHQQEFSTSQLNKKIQNHEDQYKVTMDTFHMTQVD